jgi:hypothetical protein
LLFENDEYSVDEVLQEALSAKRQRDAEHTGRRKRGSYIKTQNAHRHQGGNYDDYGAADAVEQVGHGARLFLAHLAVAGGSLSHLNEAGSNGAQQADKYHRQHHDNEQPQPDSPRVFRPL